MTIYQVLVLKSLVLILQMLSTLVRNLKDKSDCENLANEIEKELSN